MQGGCGIAFGGRPKERGSWPGGGRGAKHLSVLVSEKMEVVVVPVPSPLRTRTPQSTGWLLIFHPGGTRSAH